MNQSGDEAPTGGSQAGQGRQGQAVAEVPGAGQLGHGQRHGLPEEAGVDQGGRDVAGGRHVLLGDRGRPLARVGRARRRPEEVRGVGGFADQLQGDQVARQRDQVPRLAGVRAGPIWRQGEPAHVAAAPGQQVPEACREGELREHGAVDAGQLGTQVGNRGGSTINEQSAQQVPRAKGSVGDAAADEPRRVPEGAVAELAQALAPGGGRRAQPWQLHRGRRERQADQAARTIGLHAADLDAPDARGPDCVVERDQLRHPGVQHQQGHPVLVAEAVLEERQGIVTELGERVAESLPRPTFAQLGHERPEALAQLLQDDPEGAVTLAQDQDQDQDQRALADQEGGDVAMIGGCPLMATSNRPASRRTEALDGDEPGRPRRPWPAKTGASVEAGRWPAPRAGSIARAYLLPRCDALLGGWLPGVGQVRAGRQGGTCRREGRVRVDPGLRPQHEGSLGPGRCRRRRVGPGGQVD